jgi:hypothetical protein
LNANKKLNKDKKQLAFCSLRSLILAINFLPVNWALCFGTGYEHIHQGGSMEIVLIPLIAGIVFGGLGLFVLYDYYRFNKDIVKAQGEILRYDEYQSKDSNNHKLTMYRPSFAFTVNGNVYEVKSNTSFCSHIIPIGHKTGILYHKGNEVNARLAKGNDCWLGILFIVLSIPAIYLGLF